MWAGCVCVLYLLQAVLYLLRCGPCLWAEGGREGVCSRWCVFGEEEEEEVAEEEEELAAAAAKGPDAWRRL